MKTRSSDVLLRAALAGSWLVSLLGKDTPATSVWDGTYPTDQTVRGESAYRDACGSCHGAKLGVRGQTPPLAGSDFVANWTGMLVGDIFNKMQVPMPGRLPRSALQCAVCEYLPAC
jgi:mono/diheme cytochrome c family protein